MAMIIRLNREIDSSEEKVERKLPAAEVILFPGVRYERWADGQMRDDMPGGTELRSTAPVMRDWLEI